MDERSQPNLSVACGRRVYIADDQLLIGCVCRVSKSAGRHIPTGADDLRSVFGQCSEVLASQVRKIARLMDEGRHFEAFYIASFSLDGLSELDNRIDKFGFNPFEPRNEHGEWWNSS